MTPSAPPEGIVAFLFTDIEGSTRLWETYPEAMRSALAHHDALLRRAIAAHHGIVFKTIGDAFCAAFHTADDALHAATEAQIGLADRQWTGELGLRVRMAIHQGECEHRDGDYFGQPLNRVARLLSIGHGGQVLLSEAARAGLVELQETVTLLDLGLHQLKDVRDPMEVWQLLHPDLPASFPSLRSDTPQRTNLPAQTNAFIGRESELRDLRRLAGVRLLTITGLGGTGKTRLALEVGGQRLEEFRHGVWVVELEPIADPSLIAHAVAEAVGIREIPGQDLNREVFDALRERHLLLILDNCEHLLKAVAEFADHLLRVCPRIQVMTTSREALGVHGEIVYPLRPLPEPDAIELFTDRAALVRPNFAVASNAPTIARICRRLDGLPLALEMAAARVRVLTIEQIEERLENRFDLLTDGGPTQQRTLRELIDWNYELLDEREQWLLSRLGVFAGGWTIEAVEAVCTDAQITPPQILDLMTALVDKSLILVDDRTGGVRYRMLESLRQYARERLDEAGEMEQFRERHANYFLRFVEELSQKKGKVGENETLNAIERDHDDLRLALDFFAAHPLGGEAGMRLATSLAPFWDARGYYSEGGTRFATALQHPDAQVPTTERAVCLNAAGVLAFHQGDLAAAMERFNAALAIYHDLHDEGGTATGLGHLARVYAEQEDFERAYAFYREALAIQRRRNESAKVADTLVQLGYVCLEQGELDRALALYQEAYNLALRSKNREAQMYATDGLGNVACLQGELNRAREWYAESLPLCKEFQHPIGVANALLGLANATRTDAHYSLAARFTGAQEAIREEAGVPIEGVYKEKYAEHTTELREKLSSDLFEAILRAGKAMRREEAWMEAFHYAVSPDEAAEGTIQVM
jgi:predicted ATPase/class 3 adenylate cyclase